MLYVSCMYRDDKEDVGVDNFNSFTLRQKLQLGSSLLTQLTARQGQIPVSEELVIRATNDETKNN